MACRHKFCVGLMIAACFNPFMYQKVQGSIKDVIVNKDFFLQMQ